MCNRLAAEMLSERNCINVHDQAEMDYWTSALDITEEQLVAAILAAGPAVKSVRHYLACHR